MNSWLGLLLNLFLTASLVFLIWRNERLLRMNRKLLDCLEAAIDQLDKSNRTIAELIAEREQKPPTIGGVQ